MARYSRIAREVLAQGADFDMGYVRVCAAPLAAAVQKEALAWVACISAVMQKGDCLQLQVHLKRMRPAPGWRRGDAPGGLSIPAVLGSAGAAGGHGP